MTDQQHQEPLAATPSITLSPEFLQWLRKFEGQANA